MVTTLTGECNTFRKNFLEKTKNLNSIAFLRTQFHLRRRRGDEVKTKNLPTFLKLC